MQNIDRFFLLKAEFVLAKLIKVVVIAFVLEVGSLMFRLSVTYGGDPAFGPMYQRMVEQPLHSSQRLEIHQKLAENVTPSPSYGPGASIFMDTLKGAMSTVQQSLCEPSMDISPSPGSRNSPNVAVPQQRIPMQTQQLERALPHALHNNYNHLHQSPSLNLLPPRVNSSIVAQTTNSLNNPPAFFLPPYLQTLYNQSKP